MVNLITKDNKGKIRVVIISYEFVNGVYIIHRTTGQYNHKMINQPDIIVDKGLAKRTIEEQVQLRYNALIKEKKDKGYKELSGSINSYQEEDLYKIVGENNTDNKGIIKPMLAKQETKIVNRKIFDKEWYASRKIDGCRVLIYYDKGEIHTSSRGGGSYDKALQHIITHPSLLEYFTNNPTIILDAEAYKFGTPLWIISGACRRESDNATWIELYVYDIVDTTKNFISRLETLNKFQESLNLSFNPNKIWNKGDLQIQVVPHVKVSGWKNMIQLHDDYVTEGFEGCVIRDPSKVYKPGRSSYMIKIKKYDTTTGKVIGIEQGLRKYDDMVFVMETTDTHKIFKAKPMGDRDIKVDYTDNFETDYKGHLADYKFFYLSEDLIPLQPVMTAFRFDLE